MLPFSSENQIKRPCRCLIRNIPYWLPSKGLYLVNHCFMMFAELSEELMQWSSWSSCSHSCGRGYRVRRAECTIDGIACVIVSQSNLLEMTTCHKKTCNRKRMLYTKLCVKYIQDTISDRLESLNFH